MGDLCQVPAELLSVSRPPDCGCGVFHCLPSFFGGILLLALLEIACTFVLISRLLARRASHPRSTSSLEFKSEADSFNFSLQGNLWVSPLPEGDLSKAILIKPGKDKKKEKEDGSKESTKRVEATRDLPEISPVWKHVVLKDGVLIVKGADGVEEQISLDSCEVLSVSASSRPDGKWARRFPIKLYHPARTIYRQCKGCLLYAESGYEKEAWCEVLRATARAKDYDKDWYSNVKEEFLEYTNSAEKHAPYLTMFHSTTKTDQCVAKPTDEQSDDHRKPDEVISKKRLILNKLLRRNASKGKDIKDSKDEGSSRRGKGESIVLDDHENIKNPSIGSRSSNEGHTRSESTSSDSEGDKSILVVSQKDSKEPDAVLPAPPIHGHDNAREEKEIDQGLLCLNMIVGRLFFDFYHSQTRVKWLQNQFQKLISRIKTPNYIKSITIKELDLGKDPPFATALRMLPADAAGALSLEVDLEWQGGGFITIETRVDVRDQIAQEKIASQMAEPGSAGAAAAEIVSGIGKDLETAGLSDISAVVQARQSSISKKSGPGDDSSKKGGWMNSVKSMMSRVADQVSQVPLLLKIRLVSVKGTCIVSVRAPPSDRLWFSFKEMPNIDLEPETCIGDHHINSGLLGSYIANQIKVQIREQVVMPYRQDLFLHWMMAKQDDWLPQSAIPVAFAAVEVSEIERQISKQNIGVQPKLVEESDKNGQPPPCTPSVKNEQINGQNKVHMRQISVASSHGASCGSTGPESPLSPSSPHAPLITQMQSSTTPETSLRDSSVYWSQSQFRHSFPTRPPGATTHSPAPSSIEDVDQSDLTRPSLNRKEYKKDKSLGSSIDSEAAAVSSDRKTTEHSGGSASGRELEIPSNQVANQERAKADQSADSDSSVAAARTKIIYLKNMVGTKLDESRRSVLEKLQEKRAKSGDAKSHRHQGTD